MIRLIKVIFPGWKIVGGYEKINDEYNYLLKIKDGEILDYKEIYSKVILKDLKKFWFLLIFNAKKK